MRGSRTLSDRIKPFDGGNAFTNLESVFGFNQRQGTMIDRSDSIVLLTGDTVVPSAAHLVLARQESE
jgi:hypothetical protein